MEQFLDTQLVGTTSVHRRNGAVEYVVQAAKLAGALNRQHVPGILHHADGGAVKATVNGKHALTALTINPDVVDPDDAEMLADLVMAAVNEAMRAADKDAEQKMGAVTGGMNLPGMF